MTPYAKLKKEIDDEVRTDPKFSLEELGKKTEWWLNTIGNYKDAQGQPLDTKRLRRVELFWCYWLEEGGLIQTINSLCLRFQNKDHAANTPLSHFDMSPLYRVADYLWGYIEDEPNRLSVRRRTFEYLHQYGIGLVGRAIDKTAPADVRSRFLQSFHTVLNSAQKFYEQLDDLNVREDARPLLNALKDLQLVLSEGAYNQFAELPVQARVETMIVLKILSMPELREFFGSRIMTPYREPWMANVDAMRRIMRWGDVSICEFDNLATAGESLILSARLAPFAPSQMNPEPAREWAIEFRNEVLQYVHSYRTVTGVDLSVVPGTGREVDATQPSIYLAQREREYQRGLAR